MTAKQKSLYWRKWSAVRKTLVDFAGFSSVEADAERHEIHRAALGSDKSSLALSNRDLDAILDHFDSHLVLINGPGTARPRAETQPAARLVFSINSLGAPPAYVAAISRDKFGTADWQTLPPASLLRLRMTLSARLRSKRKSHERDAI